MPFMDAVPSVPPAIQSDCSVDVASVDRLDVSCCLACFVASVDVVGPRRGRAEGIFGLKATPAFFLNIELMMIQIWSDATPEAVELDQWHRNSDGNIHARESLKPQGQVNKWNGTGTAY